MDATAEKTVLVADDEEYLGDVWVEILKLIGARVVSAAPVNLSPRRVMSVAWAPVSPRAVPAPVTVISCSRCVAAYAPASPVVEGGAPVPLWKK